LLFTHLFEQLRHAQGVGKQDAGWLNPIVDALDYILINIQVSLNGLHVPYSYGWSIILLTLFTKLLTFPFTKIQATPPTSPNLDCFLTPFTADELPWVTLHAFVCVPPPPHSHPGGSHICITPFTSYSILFGFCVALLIFAFILGISLYMPPPLSSFSVFL